MIRECRGGAYDGAPADIRTALALSLRAEAVRF